MDPSQPSPDGFCHFFRLPAELRNQIYIYALAAPKEVACVRKTIRAGVPYFKIFEQVPDPYVPRTRAQLRAARRNEPNPALLDKDPVKHSDTEANQLRYVCRQLRVETQGMTVGLNEVVFPQGVKVFNAFAARFPNVVQHQLSVVSILEVVAGRHIRASGTDVLIKICVQHPKLMVRWRQPDLDPAGSEFWDRVLMFSLAFRNDPDIVERVTTDPAYLALLRRVYVKDIVSPRRNAEGILEPHPPNLRACPPFICLDTDVYRSWCREHGKTIWGLPLSEDDIEHAMPLVEEILEHGI